MKPISESMLKAEAIIRHRKFHWCRLRNDFIDMPLWRVLAAALDLPLTQVQAFVTRLDTLANKSLPRGSVGDFDPAEFAAAHDIPVENAARLFAALEERGWIEQDCLTTFWERNPDKDDPTSTERKARERAFKAALRELARQVREGLLPESERTRKEIAVHALRDQGRSGFLSWAEQRSRLDGLIHLSTGHASHSVTGVTVTPRADQIFNQEPVDNSGAGERGAAAGSSDEAGGAVADNPQAEAAAWLLSTGAQIVTERMTIAATEAATKIERWRHQQLDGDAVALRQVIEAADRADYMGARFHNLVVDQIRRHMAALQLPLPPVATKRPRYG